MDKELANTILDQLKNGEIKEYVVTKDVFYTFREVVVNEKTLSISLVTHSEGGQVIYTYSETPRS